MIAGFTSDSLPAEMLRDAKKMGFSDKQIARCLGNTEMVIRQLRVGYGISPYVKRIDTVAAEVVAQNNYLYITYNGMCPWALP